MPGATINDVALAYVGGTLHRYLEGHGELPDETLVAACPASIRDASQKGGGGNRLFGRAQSLKTDTADPHKRLASIAAESATYRDNSDLASSTRLMELVGLIPTTLLGLTVKAATAMPFSGPTILNTTVSNVPGPTQPIYFRGARLVRVTGLGPLVAGSNLFHVIASYNGTVSMGVTADRVALPDPAHYADCMQAAFDDLLATRRLIVYPTAFAGACGREWRTCSRNKPIARTAAPVLLPSVRSNPWPVPGIST